MDDLVSVIVALGIIFSGISKLIEKFPPKETTVEKGRTMQNNIPEGDKEDLSSETWVPVYEDNRYSMKSDLSDNTENLSQRVIKKESISSTNLVKSIDNKKSDIEIKKAQSIKEKKKNLFSEGLTEEDLVKGIIFKEILSEPRSRRPYRTPIDER